MWQTSHAAFGLPGRLGFLSNITSLKCTALPNPYFASRHCACRWHHSKASLDRWKSISGASLSENGNPDLKKTHAIFLISLQN